MPRRKYDEYGYGTVDRNYLIKCPKCKEKIRVTDEDCTCQYCGFTMCPDCLKELHTTRHEGGSSNGNWLWIECNACGYIWDCY